MTQPPVPGHGPGAEPGRDSGLPGGVPVPGGGAADERVLRLADFTSGGPGDACLPGLRLAEALDRVSGPDRRCGPASDDELIGVLSRWGALESWVAAAKLGVLAELIRRRAKPGHEKRAGGDLPDSWDEGTGHEVAAALAQSLSGADNLLNLAWELQARLPGIAALLADGTIDAVKARLVTRELSVLDDERATQAEALILGELAGKSAWMAGRLAAQAAAAVDPEGSIKRRERAEREEARVRFWRESSGACALAAYGLPTDAALAANANIAARARGYKKAKVDPDATMDRLRVLAFLDIANGISAEARIARARADQARAQAQTQADAQAGTGAGQPGDDHRGANDPRDEFPADDDWPADEDWPADDDRPAADDDWPDDDRPADEDLPAGDGRPADDDRPADGWPTDDDYPVDGDRPGDGDSRGAPGPAPAAGDAGPELAANINLTFPLGTYLGLAQRPGLGHGLGPIDPKLARDLAAAAARSPHSTWCVTVTDADGVAIGHGCARPARKRKGKPPPGGGRDGPPPGRPGFTPRDDPGPPGGYGTWTLTLPDGRELEVALLPIPVTDCDHRYESPGYQPSDLLRHLVQIRDGQCTFPCCSRAARDSDFEHAVPYDQGGRTCACNAGARSRRCHKVKQSTGWTVTQPLPGWHQWTTPSGRTFTQGPMKYPV
ncbi:MAG TPA: hypothetical protein VNV62_10980 [Trebonia sp.]|nr:hypothetical protein [Trebonia sp.]